MIGRRTFFKKAAAFVAGCALGVGIELRKPPTCHINDHPLVADPSVLDGATHEMQVMVWDALPNGKRGIRWQTIQFNPNQHEWAYVMEDGNLRLMRDGILVPIDKA